MKILIAEDERISRRSLERQLSQWGHEVLAAEDGRQAWTAFQEDHFDAVVTDWQMPGLSGFDFVRQIRAAATDRYVYVIMLTSKSEAEDAVAALDAGADDFLRKPFDQDELRARLNAGERILRLEREITRHNRRMAQDLQAGARYVTSMIPPPQPHGDPAVDWLYLPAADLAGDSLGWHWIDENRCALYVLDVTGHGLDAALLSVMILNVLRTMSLPGVDFTHPAEVLRELNRKFPMEDHEHRCFTIWYGVFDRRNREITWAGGGHPAALLLIPTGEGRVPEQRRLASTGPLMGMLPSVDFGEDHLVCPTGSSLFLLSDGVFEIARPGLPTWTYDEMAEFLASATDGNPLTALLAHVRCLGEKEALDDDFTLLRARFGAAERC